MKKVLGTIAMVSMMTAGLGIISQPACAKEDLSKINVNGAGASFPYPLYSKWAYKFNELTGMKLNYQSIGSGGGIAQIKAKTVDFGASDAPLKHEDLEQNGLIQFPMIMGGVVPVVNFQAAGLKEAGSLKLSNELLADIFLGKVAMWNDEKIKSLNPSIDLPALEITVVHRSDGSGTTWIFTNFLMKVSEEWKEKVGTGSAVSWPVGIGSKGNEGVANYVKRVDGSIGYVEYAYAVQNKLTYVTLKNQAGNYVNPSIESFQAAAANADWENSPGYYVVLTDQPGENSWPITGASFIIVHKEQANKELVQAMLTFFDWCYRNGQTMATELDYVPIPSNVVEMVEKTWSENIVVGGKSVWPKK